MSQNVKNRIEWIDYSKGILIILVITGHAIPEFEIGRASCRERVCL